MLSTQSMLYKAVQKFSSICKFFGFEQYLFSDTTTCHFIVIIICEYKFWDVFIQVIRDPMCGPDLQLSMSYLSKSTTVLLRHSIKSLAKVSHCCLTPILMSSHIRRLEGSQVHNSRYPSHLINRAFKKIQTMKCEP